MISIDSLIRSGQSNIARRQIIALPSRGLPAEARLELAALARRAGALDYGLSLLYPLVRGRGGRAPAKPSPALLTEYAGLLVNKGATNEALELLKKVVAIPQANLFRAFAHFSRWEYRESLPHLRLYVKAETLPPYSRLVGELNLLAALTTEKNPAEFEALWSQFRAACETDEHKLLLQSGWEVAAQNAFFHGEFAEALARIQEAKKLLTNQQSVPALYVRKWDFCLRLLQTPLAKCEERFSLEWTSLKQEAKALESWETLRELDYFWAEATQNRNLLNQVWWGTPFAAYKQRCLERNPWWKPEESFSLPLTENGATLERESIFAPESLPQKLIQALTADFYHPATLLHLWRACHGASFYHPIASPRTMHQLLWRTRKLLEEKNIPLVIAEEKKLYYLRASQPLQLLLKAALSRHQEQLEALNKLPAIFSAKDAAQALGYSLRATNLILTDFLDKNFLRKSGATRSTRYSLKAK